MSEHETRTAFDHLRNDVADNVQIDERLAQIDKRGRWARPQLWAFAGAYVAVLVAIGFAYLAFRGDVTSGELPPATSTVPELSVPRYESVHAMRDAIEAAGLQCDMWSAQSIRGVPDVRNEFDSATCTTDSNFLVFTTSAPQGAVRGMIRSSNAMVTSTGFDSIHVSGPNWLVGCVDNLSECEAFQAALGGTLDVAKANPAEEADGIVGLPQLGLGTVVVANPEQVTAVSGGIIYLFADGVDVAVADGNGGLIVQRGAEIYRVEPGAPDDGEVALVDAAALAEDLGPVTLRLEDIAVVDGTTQVLVIVAGGEEENRYEEVWLVDPENGATESVYRTGAYEGGIARASLAGNMLVVTRTAEGFTWFEFFDAGGAPIDVSNPKPDGAEFPVFVDQGVVSPNGDTLVYLESDSPARPEDGNRRVDLVVWDLANGAEDRRMEIELGDWLNGRLDYDGTGIVLGRIQWTGESWAAGSALHIASVDADAGITTDTGAVGTPSLVKIGPVETTLGQLEACGEDVGGRTGTCLNDSGAVLAWDDGCSTDLFEAPSEILLECRL